MEFIPHVLNLVTQFLNLVVFELNFLMKFLSGVKLANEQDKNLFMILKQLLQQHVFLIRLKRTKRRIQQIKNRPQTRQGVVVKPLELLTALDHFRKGVVECKG